MLRKSIFLATLVIIGLAVFTLLKRLPGVGTYAEKLEA